MLLIKNRQRKRRVNLRLLRQMTETLMRDLVTIESYELGVYLVDERTMTGLNETHLRHAGSTDVITFDYGTLGPGKTLVGDIFVCIDEAGVQAGRYHTSWQSEVVRYVVHGVLHLTGYDDHAPRERQRMKRQEDRMLAALDAKFTVTKLAGSGSVKTARRTL